MRRVATCAGVVLLSLAGCAASDSPANVDDLKSSGQASMRLLQTNVGNVAAECSGYKFKLCDADTETRLAESIAALQPDVISLQEVVPNSMCDGMNESDPGKVCHPSRRAEPLQARRLVGSDYTIACDARSHFECVAVRRGFGHIDRCEDGASCDLGTAATTAPATVGCDAGFSVSAVRILPLAGRAFTLIDAHPPSGGAAECRKAQLTHIFEKPSSLAGGANAILSGDFNLDPYRGKDVSEVYFRSFVGAGKRFTFHSGIAEHDPPYPTARYLTPGDLLAGGTTLDHVASDFAKGRCTTLGEAPGSARLDGDSGTDHRAMLCELRIPK